MNENQYEEKDVLNQSFGPVAEYSNQVEEPIKFKQIDNFGEDELFINNFNQVKENNDAKFYNNPFCLEYKQKFEDVNF